MWRWVGNGANGGDGKQGREGLTARSSSYQTMGGGRGGRQVGVRWAGVEKLWLAAAPHFSMPL